jgi:hypothetical protein
MTNTTETEIIEAATSSWTRHRRHDGQEPHPSDIGLSMRYFATYGSHSGTWNAWCARYPARTPGRFASASGQSPNAAMEALLKEVRNG